MACAVSVSVAARRFSGVSLVATTALIAAMTSLRGPRTGAATATAFMVIWSWAMTTPVRRISARIRRSSCGSTMVFGV